jgi:hypothetical protein
VGLAVLNLRSYLQHVTGTTACSFATSALFNWRPNWLRSVAAPKPKSCFALENELARIESEKTLEERVRPIQDRIASRPATDLEADKAFFDELSGEL